MLLLASLGVISQYSTLTAMKLCFVLYCILYINDNTIPGKPITVSCAYSGRVAVAYRMGAVKTKTDNPNDKYVNLCVSIYECESTGKYKM